MDAVDEPTAAEPARLQRALEREVAVRQRLQRRVRTVLYAVPVLLGGIGSMLPWGYSERGWAPDGRVSFWEVNTADGALPLFLGMLGLGVIVTCAVRGLRAAEPEPNPVVAMLGILLAIVAVWIAMALPDPRSATGNIVRFNLEGPAVTAVGGLWLAVVAMLPGVDQPPRTRRARRRR